MPAQDTSQIKEKIVSILKVDGPSLPVHIAKKIELSILFTSAFLSELVSEKRIKMSHMRIGSSPLYFILGQEHLIEKFSFHLKSKEKEAFMLLKEKKFLEDSKQEPAIRVALREIKDFAVPFQKNEETIWRFSNVPESEFTKEEKTISKEKETRKYEKSLQKKTIEKKHEETLDIFDSSAKKKKIKKPQKKEKSNQKEDKFLNKVREFLSSKSVEITDILSFGKSELALKVKNRENSEENILIAYNKRKLNENDIIKASKKAREFTLPYIILSLGEPLKKITELISASKTLNYFEKLK